MTIHENLLKQNYDVSYEFIENMYKDHPPHSPLFSDYERTVSIREEPRKQHDSNRSFSIKYWNKTEFISWLCSILDSDSLKSQLKCPSISWEHFMALNDTQIQTLLNQMDLNEFLRLDETYGRIIYDELCELNNKQNSIQSIKCDSLASDSSFSSVSNDGLGMPFIRSITPNHRRASSPSPIPIMSIPSKNGGFLRVENGKVIKPEKKTKDCVHVWQFCRDLLKNPEHNPRIICWLDEKQLVFKINDKEEIALLWGLRKNRKSPEKMTYENMSRGMRHSRVASDYFRVPDKRLKKKFVYQFGDKAIDSCTYLKSLKFTGPSNY